MKWACWYMWNLGLGQREGRAKPGKLESGHCYCLQSVFAGFALLSLMQTLWEQTGLMGKSLGFGPR